MASDGAWWQGDANDIANAIVILPQAAFDMRTTSQWSACIVNGAVSFPSGIERGLG